MRINQEGLGKKSNNTISLAKCCFTKWEFNLKQHQIEIAKSSARKNIERERTNKSQAISTRDTGDLFYRGSALEGLVPVEESTKDESFSTLSLSPPITQGSASSSSSQGSVKTPQGPPHSLVSLASFYKPPKLWRKFNGSQNSTHKWSQDVVLTNSQWFSQGTLARLTREAFFYEPSFCGTCVGCSGLNLAHRMDQWIYVVGRAWVCQLDDLECCLDSHTLKWPVGVVFIATNQKLAVGKVCWRWAHQTVRCASTSSRC